MANDLFNIFGGGIQPQQNAGPFTNVVDVMNRFNQFRSTFQGNPQEKVQELLNTGQMSKEQFNQLSGMAQLFQQLLHK